SVTVASTDAIRAYVITDRPARLKTPPAWSDLATPACDNQKCRRTSSRVSDFWDNQVPGLTVDNHRPATAYDKWCFADTSRSAPLGHLHGDDAPSPHHPQAFVCPSPPHPLRRKPKPRRAATLETVMVLIPTRDPLNARNGEDAPRRD